jgi:ribosomal protein S18 acetylase RimI-like enzyme
MIQIEINTDQCFSDIRDIANEVWPVAYGAILSAAQLEYMMEMMYSLPSLLKQVTDKKHHFIVAKEDEVCLGFASFEFNFNGTNKTKIHKIYVYTHQQGKGIGKHLIDFIANQATVGHQQALVLNVNRNNSALHFYQQIGFAIQGEEDIDIGNGYLMEDYIMEKSI